MIVTTDIDQGDAQPMRFVSIGECMVEMAPAALAGEYRLGFAGDTLNTAWYVKALAPTWQSRFVSRVGQDSVSDDMLAMMAQAGLETDHILRSPDRSVGLYLINLVNGERSFSYWRDRSAARLLADDAGLLGAATEDAGIVYFTGITLAILDLAGRETLFDVVRDARASGKKIVFDSNLRPRLWASPELMTETVMEAAGVADVVLPSFDDEAQFFGDADAVTTRSRYLAAGSTTVIVKNAGGEVHFAKDGVMGSVMPPPVNTIVDTTSAGDSFNAGVLVGLESGMTCPDAIQFACSVAGHVIGEKGALVPLPPELKIS